MMIKKNREIGTKEAQVVVNDIKNTDLIAEHNAAIRKALVRVNGLSALAIKAWRMWKPN